MLSESVVVVVVSARLLSELEVLVLASVSVLESPPLLCSCVLASCICFLAAALAIAISSIIFCMLTAHNIVPCRSKPCARRWWLLAAPATARESAESLPNLSTPSTVPFSPSSEDA